MKTRARALSSGPGSGQGSSGSEALRSKGWDGSSILWGRTKTWPLEGFAVKGSGLGRPALMRASAGRRVAGITAADTNGNEGIAGAAWNCKILRAKVMDAEVNKARYPGKDDEIGYGRINMGRALIVYTLTK